MKRLILRLLIGLPGLLLLPTSATAATALERNAALGTSGEIYEAKAGVYGALFPQGQDAPASNPVLALEVTKPAGQTERLLVPGTEGQDHDRSPALVVEHSSNTLFLLWEHRLNTIHSVLKLVSFDGTKWGTPIQISSNPFSAKVAPQLTVTRDSFQASDANGNLVTRYRTVLQLVWEEENYQGSFDVFYSPVILEDGTYLGWNPVYNLSAASALETTQRAEVSEPPAALVNSPVIQGGRDSRTAIIAFVSATTRRLVTTEVDLLPEELGIFAEKLRVNIIDMGARQNDRRALARDVKEALLAEESAFEPEVLNYLATQAYELIANSGDEPIDSLAPKLRVNIIDMGARLSGRGLRSGGGSAKSEEIPRSAGGEGINYASHWIQLRTNQGWPAPSVGEGQIRLFVANSGNVALVSWKKADRVFYRLTEADGWTDQKEIRLTETVTLDKAYELLESKVRNR